MGWRGNECPWDGGVLIGECLWDGGTLIGECPWDGGSGLDPDEQLPLLDDI